MADGERRAADHDIRNRVLVTIATRVTESGLPDLVHVDEEVAAIRDWLCDAELRERRFTLEFPEFADDPGWETVRETFEKSIGKQWSQRDALFLYVTGHGKMHDRTHYLVMHDSELGDQLVRSSMGTEHLIRLVKASRVERAVIIIDTCSAGAAVLSFKPEDLPEGWILIGSAADDQEATQRTLSRALTRLLANLRDETTAGRAAGVPNQMEYLRTGRFVDELDRQIGRIDAAQQPRFWIRRYDAEHVCLPNPAYRPDSAVPVSPHRRDLAVPRQELEAYWTPRANGVREHRDGRWLFTGRERLMRRLIDATTGPPGVLIVTGPAGSGKSATLARLVTLSDPRFRQRFAVPIQDIPPALRPHEGAVDAAVLATGKSVADILEQVFAAVPGHPDHALANTVDETGPDPEWLHRWRRLTRDLTAPLCVVIDAVDECSDPRALIDLVLSRLDPERTRLRLILGLRSPRRAAGDGPAGADHGASLLDRARPLSDEGPVFVDDEPWWDQRDIGTYVENILRGGPGTGMRGSYRDRRRWVEAIVERAETSFLFAGMAAENLRAREELGALVGVPDPSDLLDEGIPGLLREELARTVRDEPDRDRAVALLGALAFARGKGVPWRDIWPAMASALGGRVFTDDDVAWLLDHPLAGYVAVDVDEDRLVYRLFHDELRRTLRSRRPSLLGEEPT